MSQNQELKTVALKFLLFRDVELDQGIGGNESFWYRVSSTFKKVSTLCLLS